MDYVVGVLLDRETFLGIPKHRTGYERIALYNKAAQSLGLKPFYMCLANIKGNSALGYCYQNKAYQLVRLPIPEVTHNRAMTLTTYLQRKLKHLARLSYVFNEQNRYDKLLVHRMLKSDPTTSEYLPESAKYTRKQLIDALKNYSSIYIKPTNSSVGKGVIQITKSNNGYWRLFWSNLQPKLMTEKQVIDWIGHKIDQQSYMIQEAIPLATYRGNPYDLRISVQLGDEGKWQVTGMAGKVAASGRHVTNLAKGGEAKHCEALFRSSGFDPLRMKQAVEHISLTIAQALSKRLPHLADIGLDLGIDQEGQIKFIEMNGRDQRYEFKKLNLHDIFYQTYKTPFQYAKYRMTQGKKGGV
ncbi:YheC/YheD family protein [Paenibacillus sp. N3.4]|uniref:YheC/YheD family endospore coat-associated protein n=1 Tax=Paenibacillus sp. N3.4 TaxID=2603222 RepID=UPI0011CC8027|nr:YheC/YheD family protein [Paenibacillus sp. N3.4]TXK76950.1 YheC/YheD family protein [Paenibacillus sp. N3.4]